MGHRENHQMWSLQCRQPQPSPSENVPSLTGSKLFMPHHKSTLLCLLCPGYQRLLPQSSKQYSKLLDGHLSAETGGYGAGNYTSSAEAHRIWITSRIIFPAADFSGELVLHAYYTRQEQYRKASDSHSVLYLQQIFIHTRYVVGTVLSRKWQIGKDKYSLPSWSLQSTL